MKKYASVSKLKSLWRCTRVCIYICIYRCFRCWCLSGYWVRPFTCSSALRFNCQLDVLFKSVWQFRVLKWYLRVGSQLTPISSLWLVPGAHVARCYRVCRLPKHFPYYVQVAVVFSLVEEAMWSLRILYGSSDFPLRYVGGGGYGFCAYIETRFCVTCTSRCWWLRSRAWARVCMRGREGESWRLQT